MTAKVETVELTVFNKASNPIERAGRVFPPRRQVTVTIEANRESEVATSGHLEVRETKATAGDLGSLKKGDLQELARARGLDDGGSKAEILERLEAANPSEQPPAA